LPLYIPKASTHFASLEAGLPSRGRPQNAAQLNASTSSEIVDVTTLDAFFTSDRKPPHFLKIDVEGHELSVLKGGLRTLEMHHPTILVECETRHRSDGDIRPVLNFLESLGYMGSFFCQRRRRPLAEFDTGVHQRLDAEWAKLPSGYVNNFAFEFAM
jgi:hypothetical protein